MPRGYSLLELIVTLALTSLVLGISTPIFNRLGILAHRREVELILGAITRARALSSLEGAIYYVQFPPNAIRVFRTSGSTIFQRSIPYRVTAQGQHHPTVAFYASGAATPISLRLVRGGISCDIVITLRGRIRTTC